MVGAVGAHLVLLWEVMPFLKSMVTPSLWSIKLWMHRMVKTYHIDKLHHLFQDIPSLRCFHAFSTGMLLTQNLTSPSHNSFKKKGIPKKNLDLLQMLGKNPKKYYLKWWLDVLFNHGKKICSKSISTSWGSVLWTPGPNIPIKQHRSGMTGYLGFNNSRAKENHFPKCLDW